MIMSGVDREDSLAFNEEETKKQKMEDRNKKKEKVAAAVEEKIRMMKETFPQDHLKIDDDSFNLTLCENEDDVFIAPEKPA